MSEMTLEALADSPDATLNALNDGRDEKVKADGDQGITDLVSWEIVNEKVSTQWSMYTKSSSMKDRKNQSVFCASLRDESELWAQKWLTFCWPPEI